MGANQQSSSRDTLASTQDEEDEDIVLGTTCCEHSRGAGRKNGAGRRLQNSMACEGLQLSKGADPTENKTGRCAWLPGAEEPSHCLPAIAIQTQKPTACLRNSCHSRLLLLYSQPNHLPLDIMSFTYPDCPSLFHEAMHLNLKDIT